MLFKKFNHQEQLIERDKRKEQKFFLFNFHHLDLFDINVVLFLKWNFYRNNGVKITVYWI